MRPFALKTLAAAAAALALLPSAAHAVTPSADLAVDAYGDGSGQIQPGGTKQITLKVFNHGPATATGAVKLVTRFPSDRLTVLAASASDGGTCTDPVPGPVDPLATVTCTFPAQALAPNYPEWLAGYRPEVRLTLRAADYVPNEFASFDAWVDTSPWLTDLAQDNHPGGSPGDPSHFFVAVPYPHGRIATDIQAPATLTLGQTAAVRVQASNQGTVANVPGTLTTTGSLSDSALEITDAEIPGGTCTITHGDADSFRCDLDDVTLPAGEASPAVTLHVHAARTASGPVSLSAQSQVSTLVNDTTAVPSAAIVIDDPATNLDVQAAYGTILPGGAGDITLRLVNRGPGAGTGPVTLTGRFPARDLTVLSATATDGGTCADPVPGDFGAGPVSTVTCTFPARRLQANAQSGYTPTATVRVRAAGYVAGERTAFTAWADTGTWLHDLAPGAPGKDDRAGGSPDDPAQFQVTVPIAHGWLMNSISAPSVLWLGDTGTVRVATINRSGDDTAPGTLTVTGSLSDSALEITDASLDGGTCTITRGAADGFRCERDGVALPVGVFEPTDAIVLLHVHAARLTTGPVSISARSEVSTLVNDGTYEQPATVMILDPSPPPTPTEPGPTDTSQTGPTDTGTHTDPTARTGKLTVELDKSRKLTVAKNGKLSLPVSCHGDGGCAASKLTIIGKAGKLKINATAKLGLFDDGKPATATVTLPAKTLKALARAHVRKLKLTVTGAGRPATITVTFKR
jgi:hypothetical protein